jgi:AraC-like DNA-binding protein
MGDTVRDRPQAIGGQTGFGSRAPAVLIEYLYGTEYLRDKNIPLNVFLLNRETMPHGGLHAHEYFQIGYVYRSSCEHTLGQSRHRMVKGEVFVIPPGIPHALRAGGESDVLYFECEFMPSLVDEHFGGQSEQEHIFDFAYLEPFLVSENRVRPRFSLSGRCEARVENLLFEMLDEYDNKRRGYEVCLKAQLLMLLVLLGREYESAEGGDAHRRTMMRYARAIDSTIQYINESYATELSLRQVAALAGMSVSSFSRFFKLFTRRTFLGYVNNLRVRRAMELLRNGGQRVVDVCLEVGFNDLSHFDRVFRGLVGVSPSVYRRMGQSTLMDTEGIKGP